MQVTRFLSELRLERDHIEQTILSLERLLGIGAIKAAVKARGLGTTAETLDFDSARFFRWHERKDRT
jgi:hypothetical protein